MNPKIFKSTYVKIIQKSNKEDKMTLESEFIEIKDSLNQLNKRIEELRRCL